MHRFVLSLLTAGALGATLSTVSTGSTLSAQARQVPGVPGVPVRSSTPSILPGTGVKAFIVIQGNALDAANSPLAQRAVRLRDARYGRVVHRAVTDKSGLFEFRSVDPGSYVVELLGPQQVVQAASELLHVNAGESASVIVKLPLELKPIAGFLGHTISQAATILSTAAASGVLASSVVGVDATPQVR
jgi:hypothetical protein